MLTLLRRSWAVRLAPFFYSLDGTSLPSLLKLIFEVGKVIIKTSLKSIVGL